ncbi:glycoside hydrolase [Lacihabitans sp. LS3-19]|uniref:glycoside hydrolase n=1 Tax=Lacihabitans sp. LS3-19 TaxID=2487335 RepID=UPI0020CF3D4A|nr:glycoside hydrolase [Lacihabitans sp. LS3-19]MCP9769595.1 glycoside hydrolase [Lacihabitans sp. LS3-19]
MKKSLALILFLTNLTFAQTLKIDTSISYQTIHSFGASDCWSMQMVGKFYPENKREKIAELLFSKEVDKSGNPKGIGLSMWRFNIGAGSTEQGEKSMISNEWRRAECFLENGKYDWKKQAGQQWFLDAAKRYGVDYKLGFLNSAPVSMTKNGLSIASGKLGDWNFDKSKINAFTDFLAAVSSKLELDYLSPFNEPQWDWGPKSKTGFGSQEGTPIDNADLAWATRKIDEKFSQMNLKTKINIAETAQIDYLYSSKTNRSETHQDNQIEAFFDKNSKDYLGDLKTLQKAISGHSYFTTSPKSQLDNKRRELGEKVMQNNIDYWQSEYCVLGDNSGEINGSKMDLGMETALYVAKVIHADLTLANASAWYWWLSVSANDYKDGLIYISNNGQMGENDQNKYDGEVLDSKLLWTLGNFSRFVRPGMQRTEVSLNLDNCLISAYKSKKEVVVVIINEDKTQTLDLPVIWKNQKTEMYLTSKNYNLTLQNIDNKRIVLSEKSISTIVLKRF